MGFSKAWRQVLEFHHTFGSPYRNKPTLISNDEANLRYELLREELNELMMAMNNHDLVEIADALGDILYVTYGAAIQYGIPLDDVVDEIHRSNMTKLDNGKVVKRSDGKILKGPNYEPPNIRRVLKLD